MTQVRLSPAKYLDVKIVAGDQLEYQVQLIDVVNYNQETVKDVTGITGLFQAKDNAGLVVLELNSTDGDIYLDEVNNIINIRFLKEKTEALTADSYAYQFQITQGSKIETLFEGVLHIVENIATSEGG